MRALITIGLLFVFTQAAYCVDFQWRMRDGSIAPNTNNQKSINGFGGWLLVTPDEDWEEEWNTPRENVPQFSEAEEVMLGEQLTILAFFANPKLDQSSNFKILCDIKLTRPDGSFSVNEHDVLCAQGKLKDDPRSIFLAQTVIKYIGEEGDQFGKWSVYFNIKDVFRNVSVPLETSFRLVKNKASKSIEPQAEGAIPLPDSWAFPQVIESARKISPKNIDGRLFNQFGLAYSTEDLAKLDLKSMTADELQKYADIVTHAYPDAVANQLPNSCDNLPVEELNETAVAGIAYVSINATKDINRNKAKACLAVIQSKLN
ncbi:MAG: hypothetical protein AB7D06_17850 [Pedobacter sp.]